ncbi:hypothetical protein HanXRQr2_Chr14g0620411 [Helianthus annuus]|uniref:Uncharacterized protein n=1 Tax=Helianthus annuus TaxID=4232 RepID=A0A251SE36_HELAN|nr:hypothetical protein HanXRQr2_Chr14g0620411 [Helianthus annuus]
MFSTVCRYVSNILFHDNVALVLKLRISLKATYLFLGKEACTRVHLTSEYTAYHLFDRIKYE